MSSVTQDFLIVMVLGVLIGSSELISRYKDDPVSVLKTIPGNVYLALNAAAAAAALALIRLNGWSFGVDIADTNKLRWAQVLIAGFGAMVVFRSSLFNVRVGNQDVAVGPNSFLQVALGAADSAVDRQRGARRAKLVSSVMERVLFDQASTALPLLCIRLMQNLSPDQVKQVETQAEEIRNSKNLTARGKALALGLILMNNVGIDVLRAAVSSLGEEIATPQESATARLAQKIGFGSKDPDQRRRKSGTPDGSPAVVPPPLVDISVDQPATSTEEGTPAPATAAIISEATQQSPNGTDGSSATTAQEPR